MKPQFAIITDGYYLAKHPSLAILAGTVISKNQPTPEDSALYTLQFGSKTICLFEDEVEILKA